MYSKTYIWVVVLLYLNPVFLFAQSLEKYISNIPNSFNAKGISAKSSILKISKNEQGLFVLTQHDGCYSIDQRYKRTAWPVAHPTDKRDRFKDIIFNSNSVHLCVNENQLISITSGTDERQPYASSSFAKRYHVSHLVMNGAGNIYVGTKSNGVFIFSKNENGSYNQEPKNISVENSHLPSNSILYLYKAPDETIWVGTNLGLASIKGGQVYNHSKPAVSTNDWNVLQKIKSKPAPLFQSVFAISSWGDNLIWAGEGNLNRAIIIGDSIRYLHEYPLTEKLHDPIINIKDLIVDLDGNIWLAANHLLRYNFTKDELSVIDEIYAIKSQGFLSIEEDLEADKIWIGTKGGGLYQLKFW